MDMETLVSRMNEYVVGYLIPARKGIRKVSFSCDEKEFSTDTNSIWYKIGTYARAVDTVLAWVGFIAIILWLVKKIIKR